MKHKECLPNFLVIGAQKSGSTSLCDALAQHPEIFISTPKELHFFSEDAVFARGFSWYASLFENANGAAAVGEGSTSYTMNIHRPNAPARIARHLPQAQLIYVVRHPLQRIESGWRHLRLTNRTRKSLSEALEEFPHLVDTSRYFHQLSFYRAHFPDDRILVVFFEDLVSNPEDELARCFSFLGVDNQSAANVGFRHMGASKLPRLPIPMTERARVLYGRITSYIPEAIVKRAKAAVFQPFAEAPQWDPKVRRDVSRLLAQDAEQFLSYCGKRKDFWTFDALDPADQPAAPAR